MYRCSPNCKTEIVSLWLWHQIGWFHYFRWVWMTVSLSVSPMIDWWPVQDVNTPQPPPPAPHTHISQLLPAFLMTLIDKCYRWWMHGCLLGFSYTLVFSDYTQWWWTQEPFSKNPMQFNFIYITLNNDVAKQIYRIPVIAFLNILNL